MINYRSMRPCVPGASRMRPDAAEPACVRGMRPCVPIPLKGLGDAYRGRIDGGREDDL